MKQLRLYLDTSVIGSLYADYAPKERGIVRELPDRYTRVALAGTRF